MFYQHTFLFLLIGWAFINQPSLHTIIPNEAIILNDTTLVDITTLDKSIILDIRYATPNNFTQKVLYPCAKAYLRRPVALALVAAQKKFKAKGFSLKIYDAYRPLAVQWKLWEMYGNPDYVADPRKGSMHNRGAAVDVSLVDKKGQELDMGTPFDFFGEKAHTDYKNLPQKVRANRYLLRSILKSVGFSEIKTEWWHYSYTLQNFTLSDMPFECK
jgi:zinc D-Ala-D-Ala dipeptidase